jgi:hypothetical protein
MLHEVPASLDQGRTDLLLQFILATAAQEDDWRSRELGPIHLLKYAYLADLAYAERREGASFTGATWQFYHFGPWQLQVFERIEPALAAIHANAKKISSRYEGDFIRYSVADEEAEAVRIKAEKDLPLGLVGTIQSVVHEFGGPWREPEPREGSKGHIPTPCIRAGCSYQISTATPQRVTESAQGPGPSTSQQTSEATRRDACTQV